MAVESPLRVYRVFRVPSAGAQEVLLKDDLVSRQSVEVRDAKALGVEGEGTLILVEGAEAGVARAEVLMQGVASVVKGPEAEAVYRRFRSQDDDAASGMGLIFGG